jgi:hypothetical protein
MKRQTKGGQSPPKRQKVDPSPNGIHQAIRQCKTQSELEKKFSCDELKDFLDVQPGWSTKGTKSSLSARVLQIICMPSIFVISHPPLLVPSPLALLESCVKEGTLLETVPSDLLPIISIYWRHYKRTQGMTSLLLQIFDFFSFFCFSDRGTLKDTGYRFKTTFGSEGTTPGLFKDPFGLAVDGFGHLCISDRLNHRVQGTTLFLFLLTHFLVTSFRD